MSLFDGKPLEEGETPTLSGYVGEEPIKRERTPKPLVNTESGGYRKCQHAYEVLECVEKRIVRRCTKCYRRQTIKL